MNNNYGKFLPIGTVVLLKGAKKRLMIIGFCSYDLAKKDKAYDYTGCLYPEGVINSKEMALFNHSQIDKIYYLGLRDKEEVEFKKKLVAELNKLTQGQSNNTNNGNQ